MKKIIAFAFLSLFAVSFSKTLLAEAVPTLPPATHDDVVVVMDDDFLQKQSK